MGAHYPSPALTLAAGAVASWVELALPSPFSCSVREEEEREGGKFI